MILTTRARYTTSGATSPYLAKEIAIRRARPADQAHESAYVALRDAFLAAWRKLQDYERRRRLEVKSHIGPAEGWVCELHAGHGWGRIETDDGRLLYFHRNSVLAARFKDLATAPRCALPRNRDRGPQASTVHVIS